MTILKALGFGQIKINGKEVVRFDRLPMNAAIVKSIEWLSHNSIATRDFSSLEIRFSKREIIEDNDELIQSMILAAGNSLETVESTDLVPGTEITWAKWNELMDDPVWTNAMKYANSRDKSTYTSQESDSIIKEFFDNYWNTPHGNWLWEKL